MEYITWRHGEPVQRSERVKEPTEPTKLALDETPPRRDRETMNDKINERYLIKQLGQNPFLDGSYIDDLNIQQQFLRPKSSHADNNEAK